MQTVSELHPTMAAPRRPDQRRLMKRLLGRLAIPIATLLAVFAVAAPAHASLPVSQLKFLDYRGDVYSIYVHGKNVNGADQAGCFSTPNQTTIVSNWWWASTTYVTLYLHAGCKPLDNIHMS